MVRDGKKRSDTTRTPPLRLHLMASSIEMKRKNGAAYRIRTYDPRITNAMLYQLS
jgi:hypothetical protein